MTLYVSFLNSLKTGVITLDLILSLFIDLKYSSEARFTTISSLSISSFKTSVILSPQNL